MALPLIARKIPVSIRGAVADRLIDLMLNSKKANRIPSNLAKNILYYWQRDQLASEVGLQHLLEAVMTAEPEETERLFREEFGLKEFTVMLKEVHGRA